MENSLFNDKTIQDLIKDKPKPNAQQKTFSKLWLDLIEKGELMKEKRGYFKFYDIILKGILGYEDLEHEKENVEFTYEKDGKSIVRIEAKGMEVKDLFVEQKRVHPESPVEQLWRYMKPHATPYGIVTNYKIFILFKYSVGSLKYHLFDFESIKENPDKLAEFIAIFSKESIDNEFVEKIYEKSIIEEREFTKEFYKLFHETRLMMIKEFEGNSEISGDASIHFSQLFLNRLMFIFFAEDTEKLESKIIENRILKMLERNQDLFSDQSKFISDLIVTLFNELDKGNPPIIFGFNGGLFKHPIPPKIFFKDFRNDSFFKEVRQHFKLKKEISLNEKEKIVFDKFKNKLNPIIKNILLMASFDFNTEVNVNILGHIFEQSISDLEGLKGKEDSRRKKEGIFYTPEYITDYICRNTIIPYLSKSGTNNVNHLLEEYSGNIQELEDKFKSVKILDPACGSGAFLIKAIDVMLEIFKAIQEYKESIGKYKAVRGLKRKSDITGQVILKKWNEQDEIREIIENNIYGVDINEESIEITNLSLFFKIARKNKRLIDLSKNIKQGNSLIDAKEVAGEDKAFKWEERFKQIIDNKGFDIIIGNPPYGSKFDNKETEFLLKKYTTNEGELESFKLFIEKGISLLKENGKLGFIVPNTWLYINRSKKIREFLLNKTKIFDIVELAKYVFQDAPDMVPAIVIFEKPSNPSSILKNKCKVKAIPLKGKKIEFLSGNWRLNSFVEQKVWIENKDNIININLDEKTLNLLKKIEKNCLPLNKYSIIKYGVKTGDNVKYVKEQKEDENYRKCLLGRDIGRYFIKWDKKFLNYGKWLAGYRNENIEIEKILIQYTRKLSLLRRIIATLDDKGEYYPLNSLSYIYSNSKLSNYTILGILNSKLMNFYFANTYIDIGIKPIYLVKLPIKEKILEEQKHFIEKVDLMLKLNKEFYEKKDKFLRLLKHEYNLGKISKKLDKFYKLDFDNFVKQLGIKKLSMDKKSELINFFDKNKKEIFDLKEKIDKTDYEIDELVYDLYGLTEKEKEIIKKNG